MTWAQTMNDLKYTFDKWRIKDWSVIPSRIESRKTWYANRDETRVTVRFVKDGAEQRFSLDTQDRPQDNLRALYLGLESMRMNEVRGIGEVVREMYAALPAPKKQRDPFEVLGVSPAAAIQDIEDMYRLKAKRLHPDAGGDPDAFKELTAAYEAIKAR
jgi:hypothetical protein